MILIFDLFGTLFDWRGTIIRRGQALEVAQPDMAKVDWNQFATLWMREYPLSLSNMVHWTNLDSIMAAAFYRLAGSYGLNRELALVESLDFATIWSRLEPWPDVRSNFEMLKKKYKLYTFSNANFMMSDSLQEHSDLHFDGSISAEGVKVYKPNSLMYQYAIMKLKRPASEICLVASHCFDLNAANQAGMKTVLLSRDGEPGSNPKGLDHTPLEIVSSFHSLLYLRTIKF